MNWQRYWRQHRVELVRWGIVVVSAILVGIFVVWLSQALDKSYTFHYPHDDSRQQVVPWHINTYSPIRMYEDEH